MRHIVSIILSVFIVASSLDVVCAGNPAPCFVSAVTGDVTLQRGDATPVAVKPFQWLLRGDKLVIPREGHIRLAFLEQGISESWQGATTLVIVDDGARDATSQQQPKIVKLGVKRIAVNDDAALRSQGELVAGQYPVRSFPVDKKLSTELQQRLDTLKQDYSKLKKQLPDDDVTPEMYYLLGLKELGQRATMAKLIQHIELSTGDNAALRAMLSR